VSWWLGTKFLKTKILEGFKMKKFLCLVTILGAVIMLAIPLYAAEDSKDILKEGLLGAVTGAVAADQSGGKAGKGALIGAGTNVIGGAVLDTVFGGGGQAQQGAGYPSPAPQQTAGGKILKQGVLGAATGAVAAGASGGKAGKGALIGAGTNVIGGALLDTITGPGQQPAPAQQQPVYAPQPQYPPQAPQAPVAQAQTQDAQYWYQRGYQDGFKAGYDEGLNAQRPIVVPRRE
jgi:hypothetical protein